MSSGTLVFLPGFAASELIARRALFDQKIWVGYGPLAGGNWGWMKLAADGINPDPSEGLPIFVGNPMSDYYGNMIDLLKRDLPPDQYRVLPLGWDWRHPPQYTAGVAIDRLRRIYRAEAPWSFVCHSFGGLIARAIWKTLGAEAPDTIRRIITIGTPHFGSYIAATDPFQLRGPIVEGLAYLNTGIKAFTRVPFALEPALTGTRRVQKSIMRTAGTWPCLYASLPFLNDQQHERDPNAENVFDPAEWPTDRGISPAWLQWAKNEWQPWIQSPDAVPPANVLTCVQGNGYVTPIGGPPAGRALDFNAYTWSGDADAIVPLWSSAIGHGPKVVVAGFHDQLCNHPDVLGGIVEWVREDRPPPPPPPPDPPIEKFAGPASPLFVPPAEGIGLCASGLCVTGC
jgi:hypothetical protein